MLTHADAATAISRLSNELLDKLADYPGTHRPDLQIWLDIHELATAMCRYINEANAPKETDA